MLSFLFGIGSCGPPQAGTVSLHGPYLQALLQIACAETEDHEEVAFPLDVFCPLLDLLAHKQPGVCGVRSEALNVSDRGGLTTVCIDEFEPTVNTTAVRVTAHLIVQELLSHLMPSTTGRYERARVC